MVGYKVQYYYPLRHRAVACSFGVPLQWDRRQLELDWMLRICPDIVSALVISDYLAAQKMGDSTRYVRHARPEHCSSHCTFPTMPPQSAHACKYTDVLIIGAGPAGLMAANALVHAGITVCIVDKK